MGKAALSSTPPRPTLGRSVGASVNVGSTQGVPRHSPSVNKRTEYEVVQLPQKYWSESLIENAETLATWSPAQPSVLLASIAGGSMTGDEHDGDLPRSMNHDLLEHFDDVERDMLHGEWEDAEGGYRAGAVLDNVEVNQEDSDDEVPPATLDWEQSLGSFQLLPPRKGDNISRRARYPAFEPPSFPAETMPKEEVEQENSAMPTQRNIILPDNTTASNASSPSTPEIQAPTLGQKLTDVGPSRLCRKCHGRLSLESDTARTLVIQLTPSQFEAVFGVPDLERLPPSSPISLIADDTTLVVDKEEIEGAGWMGRPNVVVAASDGTLSTMTGKRVRFSDGYRSEGDKQNPNKRR